MVTNLTPADPIPTFIVSRCPGLQKPTLIATEPSDNWVSNFFAGNCSATPTLLIHQLKVAKGRFCLRARLSDGRCTIEAAFAQDVANQIDLDGIVSADGVAAVKVLRYEIGCVTTKATIVVKSYKLAGYVPRKTPLPSHPEEYNSSIASQIGLFWRIYGYVSNIEHDSDGGFTITVVDGRHTASILCPHQLANVFRNKTAVGVWTHFQVFGSNALRNSSALDFVLNNRSNFVTAPDQSPIPPWLPHQVLKQETLTAGWIHEFIDDHPSTRTPTLQVVVFRRDPIGYRARISDGEYSCHGTFAANLNEKIEKENIYMKVSTLRVLTFEEVYQNTGKIINILEYALLSKTCPAVGYPLPHTYYAHPLPQTITESLKLSSGWIKSLLDGSPSSETPSLQVVSGMQCGGYFRVSVTDGISIYNNATISPLLREQVEASSMLNPNRHTVIRIQKFITEEAGFCILSFEATATCEDLIGLPVLHPPMESLSVADLGESPLVVMQMLETLFGMNANETNSFIHGLPRNRFISLLVASEDLFLPYVQKAIKEYLDQAHAARKRYLGVEISRRFDDRFYYLFGNCTTPVQQSTPSLQVPMSGNNANVMPIRSLSPYISGKWRIYGNAVSKENLKEIPPRYGNNSIKKFSFILSDNQDDIKISCSGKTAERVAGIVTEGQWFYVSDGANALRGADKRFNPTSHEYEIMLNATSTVELAEDQSQKGPKMTFKVVPLSQMANCVAQSIDVLAVIETVGDVTSSTTKDNRELKKRELTLIDQTSTSVQLTLWNENAESWTVEPSRVIGIKGATVKEFNGGLSLSIGFGGRLEIDPAGTATDELLKWYAAERPNAEIKSVSTGAGGSGGNANSPAEFRVLSLINNGPMVNSYDRGVYFNSVCMIMSIRTENAVYPACPTDNCNKKVTEVDGGYRCEECCKTTADCKYRYMVNLELSDGVSHAWATMFDDKAVALFGKTADEVAALKDANPEEYKRILTMPVFTTVNARLRGRTDVYNDVARVRFNVFEIKPVNHEAYSKCLDEMIERLEAL